MCAVLCSGLIAQAELKTTSEFGVTVTAEDLIGNMYELQQFWPAVRAYLVSKDFKAADLPTRRRAASLLAQVDSSLTKRL
ncbi:MAG: hypothetical protein N2C14_04260, partial [Planctomycetales bacterium]